MATHATPWRSILIAVTALLTLITTVDARQHDASAILQFERAADSYAFVHRQDERRSAPSTQLSEGRFFTPIAAAAFRARIRAAVAAAGCSAPAHREGGYEVPAVNGPAASTEPLPPCIVAALPRLPEELAYRVAGVALILADAHRNVVVDILHAAFP